jgi:glycosyltransferase involved in cell wall biosynthesis
MDRRLAHDLLKLPQDKHLILFGAMSSTSDARKGFQNLQPTLQGLAARGWIEKAELIVVGATTPLNKPSMGLRDHYMGYLFDNLSLTLLYSAADVFVAPSMEDNLPNTVMEALACGTPAVAFDIGGMSDMIEHQKNGYLAHPFETDDLAYGLAWVLEDNERRQELSLRARQKVEEEFAIDKVARRYLALYSEICKV